MSRFRAKLVQSLHYQEQRVRKSKCKVILTVCVVQGQFQKQPMFFKIGVFENFAIFTGKLNRDSSRRVFL